jgi:hypothetical protein
VALTVGVPVKVKVSDLVVFWGESGDTIEVLVPFCGDAMLLLGEEPLLKVVTEAGGRVGVSMVVTVGVDSVAFTKRDETVAMEETRLEEKGQWKGMDDEGIAPKEVGPGPW